MAQMAVSEGGRFIFPYTISSALDNANIGTLQTANKFIDKDIDIKLTLASGAATVTASKQATSPTIAKTTTTVSGATNVGTETISNAAPSSGYFVSIQATAPATTLDITKTINTAGYIGANTQISASASTSAKTGSIYYLPITAGVGEANSSSASITIESTDDSSKGGVNVKSILGTAVNSEPDSGYYLRIKANGSGSSKVTTAGWFPTGALAASSTSTTEFYPVTAASVTHSGGGISITNNYSGTPTVSATLTAQTTTGVALTTTEPSSGYYLTITSNSTSLSGKTKATRAAYTETFSAGYLPAKSSTNILSSSAVEPTVTVNAGSGVSYLTIPSASVTTSSTNDGMSTYFSNGTSSDKNVTITPKYTNTAGYKAAVTTATNNGGISYWKIKTTSLSFSGGGLTGQTASATKGNITWNTDTDNGIYIQTVGTAGRAAVTYTNSTAGWLDAHTSATNASSAITASNWNGEKYYVTAINVPKDVGFTVTTTEDTALDTTSDLDITNAAYRRVDITNVANGSVIISNAGDITTTQSAKTGTIKINAYDTSGASSLAGEKTIVENGVWKTTAASAATTYYGRVTIRTVNGSIGGTATSGSATAVITNTNNIATISDLTNKTAGTDYWQIKATATGTAGGFKPKYTVTTSGWIASTVEASGNTSVSVTSDTTGKSLYIPKATFTVSGNNVNVATAGYIASGTVGTVSTGTISTSTTDPGSSYTANTTAVVPSGGYLTLSAGYYSATKISLATLVPDGSNVAGHADYLLAGKTAYDNNGVLVTGSIQTYDGTYTYST